MQHLLNKHDNNKLACTIHPLVNSAYELCNALPRKCNLTILPNEAQVLMRSSLNVYLYNNGSRLYIIGGFENINFDISSIQDYSIHILEKMSDQEILEFCWHKVFRSFISTLDNQKFGDVYDLFKKFMPEQISKQLIGRACFTQQFFSSLTRTANSTLSFQRGICLNKTKSNNERLSILDEVLGNLGVDANE